MNIFEPQGKDKIYRYIQNEINDPCKEVKKLIQQLYPPAQQYLDPDFCKVLADDFNPHFWELYLVSTFLELKFTLIPKKKSLGPDICISINNQQRVWVEAVTASAGEGKDAVEPPKYDGSVREVPDEAIQLRLLNALDKKREKYMKYVEREIIDPQNPCIIAINAAHVPSARLEHDIPRIIRSLFPIGDLRYHIDYESLKLIDTSYEYKDKVQKKSGENVKTTAFQDSSFSMISAIIYSCADAFNYPGCLGNSLLLCRNPLAVNPLPDGFLKAGIEYWCEGNDLNRKDWNVIDRFI